MTIPKDQIPDNVATTLHTRFRFTKNSGEGGESPTGPAINGEVEDYTLMSLGNLVWYDTGAGGGTANNGIKESGESGIDGVTVELFRSGDDPATDDPIGTTVTKNGGKYLFTGLEEGDYVVHIPKENFDASEDALYQYLSTVGANDPDDNVNQDSTVYSENGIDASNPASEGISSDPVTLNYLDEPPAGGNTDDDSDENSNLTVDFGFLQYDFGDAPEPGATNSQTTSLTSDISGTGAHHGIDGETYLGTKIDADTNGQPTDNSSGDDDDGNDDEDGVTFTSAILPGETATLNVIANSTGYLNAWVDWNGDGVFDDATEQVFTNENLTNTGVLNPNQLTIAVPDQPIPTTLHTRFRFTKNSGEGGDSPTGAALNGEVEDYTLMSLGNLVWHDNGDGDTGDGVANDGKFNGNEAGINGVTVELYAWGTNTLFGTTITADGGKYLFTGLMPGEYFVHIPKGNFTAEGDALYQFFSTTDQDGFKNPDNDRNEDQDENGIDEDEDNDGIYDENLPVYGISSGKVTLSLGDEPDNNDDGDDDPNSNLTLDFGFVQQDFGDAPISYGTMFDEDGARHVIDPDVYLGTKIDFESNGQPTDEADGDDANGDAAAPGDEDGIEFVTPIMPDADFGISVTASQHGYLNGWLDLNGNGTFENDERFIIEKELNAGTTEFDVSVSDFDPKAATSIYARFRFTELQNQATSPTGPADNGEVEDYAMVSLGNLVWLDNGADDGDGSTGLSTSGVANDGILNGDERGLDNVLVELYLDGADPLTTDALASTTTKNGGEYMFTGLTPNREYKVHIPPSQFVSGGRLYEYFSTTGSGAADDNINENGNPASPPDGDENGIDPTVPRDAENDGITSEAVLLQLSDEPPFGGAYDGDDDPNSNLTVDFGFLQYDFGDAPDDYGTTLSSSTEGGARHILDGSTFLGNSVDSEWDGQPTDTALGDDDATDSDDEDGVEFLTPIQPGQPYSLKISPAATASSGYLNAWIDFNGNDVFDGGVERILDNEIWNGAKWSGAADDEPLTLTLKAPDSPDPFPSTLYARFRFTRGDSDGGDSPTGEALSGEVEDYALLSLGSRLWRDNGEGGGGNNNGRMDGAEPGLSGATVELYLDRDGDGVSEPGGDDGAPVAATISDSGGNYRFTGLIEGNYFVYLPAQNFQTGGALENLYSSSDPLDGTNDPNSTNGEGQDEDTDENGIDEDFPYNKGIRSLPVELSLGDEPTGEDGDANSDLTLDFGFIRIDFGDLPDTPYPTSMEHDGARHIVDDLNYLGTGVDAESDGKPGASAEGDDASVSDDEDGVIFLSPAIMPGEPFEIQVTATTADASTTAYVTIWMDFNGDGDFDDDGEYLTASGAEEFTGAGAKTLTFTAPESDVPFASTLYSRFRLTTESGGVTTPYGEAPNGEVEDYALLSLGNLVWMDDGAGGGTPDDGKVNGSEKGIASVKFELYRAGQTPGVDDPIATTTTDANGKYLFTGLTEGDYFVHIPASEFAGGAPLAKLVSSLGSGTPNADQDHTTDENGIDDDNQAANGISSATVTLSLGDEPTSEDGDVNSNLTIDFGFVELASLGDYVWSDNNGNGIQDAGESPISGVTVNLYDKNGSLIATTTTDANGKYLFENLRPGDYYLEFITPAGYRVSPQNSGGSEVDSDVNPATGRTGLINLAAGENDMTWDAGLMPLANIGDTVWLDENGNGVQDAGEPGVPDVTVCLYTSSGELVATTTTDASGKYLFTDVPPGEYYLEFTLPPGYTFSPQNQGDDSLDSDVDQITWRTSVFTMAGVDNMTLDAGITPIPEPESLAVVSSDELVSTPTPGPTVPPTASPTPGPTVPPTASPTPGTTDMTVLTLAKSANQSSAQPGQIIEYSVTITNSGDVPVFNVVVEDALPQGFIYIAGTMSATGGNLASVGNGNYGPIATIEMIPARGSVTLSYAVVVGVNVPAGQYENQVSITGLPPATATVVVEAALGEGEYFSKRREEILYRKPCVAVPAEIEKPWFITDIAMYAASEMRQTGSPFISWSEENGLALDQFFLAPTGVREFGAEIQQFSVDNVNTVLSNSGIGLHFRYAPVMAAGAKATQLSAETYLADRLQEFAKRSRLTTVPRNMYPVFIEYAEGDPRYVRSVNINNWQSLVWNKQSFTKFLIPSAYSQSLLRQVLLLKDFLATNHHADGTQDLAGDYLGIDDAKGFVGILAAEAVVNKLWFMANTLLQDVEQQDGTLTSYFPYKITVTPESLDAQIPDLHVEDDRSRLFDQLSLLWALSELMLLTDADTPGAYQQVFDPNLLAPDVDFGTLARREELADFELSSASVHTLADSLAAIVFKTLFEHHADFEAGTIFDEISFDLSAQADALEDGQKQEVRAKVSTLFLGLTLTALERYYQAMESEQTQREHIVRLMRLGAEILLQHAYNAEDGGVFDALNFDSDTQTWRQANGELKSLNSQMAAIRGLLAAYDITQDDRYRSVAFDLYQFAERALWNADIEIYKDREKRGMYTYTPLDVGTTIGALRELIYHSADQQQMLEMIQRMRTFVRQITKYAGLQLSEVITRRDQEFLIPVDPISTIRTAQVLDSPFGLAPVLCAEISLNRDAIAALHAKRPTDACEQARDALRSTYYLTDIGMYAATELALAPQTTQVKSAKTDDDVNQLERNRNPELFYLSGLERISAKAKDFSALNLLHVQTKSSLGLLLKYGPYLRQQAEEMEITPEEAVQTLLQRYAVLSGLDHLPEILNPIFAEFEGGVPEMEYGKQTERWLEPNMDTSLLPSAVGQTLQRQALWLQEVLTARHDERNRITSDGAYIGRNAEEGFLGLVMAQAVANKLLFLRDTMQVPLDSVSASTPSGYYFPHRFEVEWDSDEPESFTVEDTASYLFDQVSLLWGLSEFSRFSASNAINGIFGNGQILSGEFHEIANTLTQRILENLEALHWNAHYGTFYDINNLDQQSRSSEQHEEGPVISTQNIALAMIALQSVYHNFSEDPVTQAAAKALLLRQIAFLQQYLLRDDGAVYNGARLADEVEPFTGLKTLLAHAAAIRSLLIAYQLTGEHVYLQQAQQVFSFLDVTFWDERLQVYRTTLGGSQHQYTPLNAGMTVGAFRELLAMAGSGYTEAMNQHFTKFFEYVIERLGLQLSEQKHLVELTQQPRTVAPVLASDLRIQPLSSPVDVNVPQPGSTLIYTIRVTEDTLNCDMTDAFIEDILPEGVTFVKSVPLPESIDDRVLRWRVSDLSADEDGVYAIRIEVIVNSLSTPGFEYDEFASGARTWRVNNCAWLSCQIPGKSDRQSRADCVEDQIQLPQLGVEKTLVSLVAEPGKDAEFEIVATNLSEVTAYTVTVQDVIPSGFIYLKDSARSSDVAGLEIDDTQPLVWVLEDLEPGKFVRFTYKVHLESQLEAGLYPTQVKVYAMDRSGFAFETNEFELDVMVERNVFLKIHPYIPELKTQAVLQAGRAFTIVTSIENVGIDNVTNGTITVTLPEVFRYVSETSQINGVPTTEPEIEEQTLRWNIADFPIGITKSLSYAIQSQPGFVGNATVTTHIRGTAEKGMAYESQPYRLDLQFLP